MGVRLPLLPLVRRHGRVRQGSALLARRRQQPLAGSNPAASASSPRSSAEKSSGFRPHARPFESGRGVHVHDATSFNGRTTGCYPGDAGSTPAVAASCPDRLDGRGRRSLTPETRVRVPLGVLQALGRVWDMRPGCLPGEAGSIPVESALLAVAQLDERRASTAGDGGSSPPGELRRKACSEPAGCESVEQGATPWRRPMEMPCCNGDPAAERPASGICAIGSPRRRIPICAENNDDGPAGQAPL